MAKSHVTNQLVRRLDDLAQTKEIEKRGAKWSNIFVGAGIQLFEVCTLGQPFEVLKTHMAGVFF